MAKLTQDERRKRRVRQAVALTLDRPAIVKQVALPLPRRSANRRRSPPLSLKATIANQRSQYERISVSPSSVGSDKAGSLPSGVGFLTGL